MGNHFVYVFDVPDQVNQQVPVGQPSFRRNFRHARNFSEIL
jgi:hypothetical protein